MPREGEGSDDSDATLVTEYDITAFQKASSKSKSSSRKSKSKSRSKSENAESNGDENLLGAEMNLENDDNFDENYDYAEGKPPKPPGRSGRRTESRDSVSSVMSNESGGSDRWDHGPHRPPSASRTPKKPLVRRRSSLPNNSRKGRKVRFTGDTKPSSAGSREKPPHYHVMILCSMDKTFEMRNLQENLDETGYDTKLLTVNDDVFSCRADVIIAAVSLRFTKAVEVASNLYKTGRPILPICLDTLTFPPANLNNLPRRLNPIDCTLMENRAEWQQTKELSDVIDRLETLIPSVRPIRGIKRERSSSNIPMARGHHASKSKTIPPLDPLAREASEITIRVKPPTPPRWDKKSHIPVKRESQSSESEGSDEENHHRRDRDRDRDRDRGSRKPLDEDLDPGIQDQGDGESLPDSDSVDENASVDSEVRAAKQLQNDYRLPPVTSPPATNGSSHRRGGSDSYRDRDARDSRDSRDGRDSRDKSSSNYRRSNSNLESGRDRDRERDRRDRDYRDSRDRDRERSSPPDPEKRSNKKISNWDGPKLPSVYRKRVAQTIY